MSLRKLARSLLSRPVRTSNRWRPEVTQLEDRATPATAVWASNVLTVTYTATDAMTEGVTFTTNGTTISLTGNVTGDVSKAASEVTRIVLTGSSGTIQSATFSGTAGFSLSGGLESTDVETVTVNNVVAATGTGAISITAGRNIALAGTGAKVTTVNGDLTLSANQQATPTGGSFTGVDVNGGLVQATGTGAVTVLGRGGDAAAGSQYGINVRGGGDIVGGTGGAAAVTGTGGAAAGNFNYGVYVFGSGSTISSGGASVSVTGQGGGSGTSSSGVGVAVGGAGKITAGGTGPVTVTGTGWAGTGGAGANYGVTLYDSSSTITSSGGAVAVTATGGGAGTTPSEAIRLQNFVTLSSGGTADLTITADSLAVVASAPTIRAGSAGKGTATIRPRTAGANIDLGGADVLTGSPLVLGLTDAELDLVTAATLVIGDAAGGSIAVTANLTRSAANVVRLIPGTAAGPITFAPGADLGANSGSPQYTQFDVVGGINLTGADLVFSGSPIGGGAAFVIVANDGTDPVVGTFNGLPEGASVTVNGLPGQITYVGGDGNDVAVTVTGNLLAILSNGFLDIRDTYPGGKDNAFTIGVVGPNLVITEATEQFPSAPAGATLSNGNRTLTVPLSLVSARASIYGLGGTNTVTVDYSGGDLGRPLYPYVEHLVLSRGTSTGVFHTITHSRDKVQLDPDGTGPAVASVINFQGGTITDALDVPHRVFDYSTAGVQLEDSGGADGRMRAVTGVSTPVEFANPTALLTVSAPGFSLYGVDPAFTGTLSASVGTGAAYLGVNLGESLPLPAGMNLTLAAETIDVFGAVSFSGAGAASLTASKKIKVWPGASVTTADGNLTLSANQQTTPTAGNFFGVDIDGGTVQATGSGAVTVLGRGGTDVPGMRGVYLHNGGDIIGGTGPVVVTGTGGASPQFVNNGVDLDGAGTTVTSSGGDITVTGTGGGTGSSTANYGVNVGGGAQVSAGGTGSITIQGTGGLGGPGVYLITKGPAVTTTNGDVTITGQGNGGVTVAYAGVSAGGTGGINIQGTGTGSSYGVSVSNTVPSPTITAGGAVSLTGASLGGATAVYVNIGGTVASGGTAPLTITADSLSIDNGTTIRAGATGGGVATIRTRTAGTTIDLGGADVLTGPSLTLGLTDLELDQITAATLIIGDATSGPLTVTQNITRQAPTDVSLNSGGAITFATGKSVSTNGGALSLNGASVVGNVSVPPGSSLGSATGAPVQLTGTVTSTGAVQIAGTVSVAAGGSLTAANVEVPAGATLVVNGDVIAPVVVRSGATLQGSDNITGTLTAEPGSFVTPGNSPGVLSVTGNVAIGGATYVVELAGTTPGTGGHDQIDVDGTVNLTNAVLQVNLLGGFTPAVGDAFRIIDNDGTDAVTGTFSGLPEGKQFAAGSTTFRITYAGGDGGNDVVLTAVPSVPAPQVTGVLVNGTTAPATSYTASRVTSLTVTFNTPVSANPADLGAGAFTLTRVSGGTLTNGSGINVSGFGTNTLTLTFTGAPGVVDSGSLGDGRWALATDLSKVRNAANAAGTGTSTTANVRRLFGDGDGDGAVTLTDFGLFGGTFGRGSASPGFRAAFDANGDGTIDLTDFAAFGQRFGKGI